jgi:hypothetical protein
MGTLFFCIALMVFAQDGVDPEPPDHPAPATESFSVDGIVLNATTRAPLPDARVILHFLTSEAVLQEMSTGVNGAFHFSIDQPGKYVVEASKDSYLSAAEKLPEGKTSIPSITLALAGSIAIRGRVRDGETRDGLPGLTVTALRVTYSRGSRELIDDRTAFTDDEGDFLLDQLMPGDYFVEIKKFPPGAIVPGDQPDTPAALSRYPQTIWPASEALAAWLAETNIGNLDLTKVKPGRIRGEVTGLDCTKENAYGLSILQRFGDRVIEDRSASIPCGASFTIPNLSPGDYVLRAIPTGPFQFASADVQIESGSDPDLRLQLRDLPDVFGSVSFDCKSDCRSVAKGLSVLLEPMFRSFSNDPAEIASSSTINENGQFRALMPLSGPVRINLRSLPDPIFVKRLIYDGADVGTTFMPDGAATETLQIVLSDQPLELNGAVQRDGQPVANVKVVLSPWPLIANDAWAAAIIVQTDAGGKFSFHNLRAGTYRAASPQPADWQRNDQRGVLAGFFASVEDITLSATGSGFVILK